ncbi:DUF427 domain-containing protein [Pararhodobacter zhoushanensis]|uniref:DUF427 domain-containing protein n=1 Tax=Pararhodobacter zhoushanensis TaxID=2479545 RepID=UPI000F8C91D9|nr:DUF427 domain-containing protein [Pararhodobacter zhoushanensis]
MARAIWQGQVIAQTDTPLMFDNNVYFPPEALNQAFFSASDHTSLCPWKGTASYYTLSHGGTVSANAAWVYRDPLPKAEAIRDHVAFWRDVTVEG